MRPSTRSITATFLFLCLAQPALAMPGHFGVRAGVNLSAFAGDFGELIEPDHRVAPNIGLTYEYPLSPNIFFHGELGYSGKGGVLSSEGTDPFGNPTGTYKATWSFDYLEVPLLIRGRIGSMGKVTPFLEMGPTVGITLAGKFKTDPKLFDEVDLKDDLKPIDVGFGAGAGLDFPVGPGRLGLEARYTRGFSDLWDIDDNASSINQAWTFALSYMR